MQTKNNNPNKKPRKKNKRRLLLWLLLILFILILSMPFLLPAFISSKAGNRMILNKINDAIDGQLNFSSLSMNWWKGIKITNLDFTDNTGQTQLSIKQCSTKPYYLSLLTKLPAFGLTTLDEPRVEINLKKQKTKTYKAKSSSPKAPILPLRKIDLAINNGNLRITDQSGQKTELSRINTRLNLNPPGQQSNFDIDMDLSNSDKKTNLTAQGQALLKKDSGWSFEKTSGNLTVEFNDLDIETLGPFFALAGVDVNAKGIASANIYTEIKNGQIEKVDGYIKASSLDITGPILKGDKLQTDNLDINAKLTRQKDLINIENLNINSDWLKAQVTGIAPTTFQSLNEFLDSGSDLQANFECQLGTLFSQMPATFHIREGMQITSGFLKGNIKTSTQTGKRNIEAQANLDGLAGKVDGKIISLSEPVMITAQIGADDKITRFDKLELSSAFAQLSFTGTSSQLEYTANTNLSKLQTELGQFFDFKGYSLAGNISQKGLVTFDKDKIGFEGSSEIKEFGITAKNITAAEPKADITYEMELMQKENILAIKSLNTTAALGKINIKDSTIALNKDAKKQSLLNISAKTIDLEKIQPFAVLFASLPEEVKLAGIADSDTSITKKNNNYEIKTDNTKIKNLKFGYPGEKDFVPEQVSLVADGMLNINNKIFIGNWQLTGPIKFKGQIEHNLQGDKGNLKGQADLEYDWPALSAMLPFLPADLNLEGSRKDNIIFSAQYPADKPQLLLENLNLKTQAGFQKAHYPGIYLGTVETNIKSEKGLLETAPISTTANNGKLNIAVNIDLKTKPFILKIPQPMKIIDNINLNDEIAQKYLPYFNPIFTNSFNVTGKANLYCEKLIVPIAPKNTKDIESIGTFSAENLSLQTLEKGLLGQLLALMGRTIPTENITVRPTDFTIKNGLLTYKDMQVDIGNNPFNFRGSIGLVDKSLDMEVELPYTIKGTTARIDQQTDGKRIKLPLKGTIDKPVLDLEKLLEIQLKDVLQDQLEQILKGKIKLDTKGQKDQNQTNDLLKGTIEDLIKNQLDQMLNEKNQKP